MIFVNGIYCGTFLPVEYNLFVKRT